MEDNGRTAPLAALDRGACPIGRAGGYPSELARR
jgi:hypothetical protein